MKDNVFDEFVPINENYSQSTRAETYVGGMQCEHIECLESIPIKSDPPLIMVTFLTQSIVGQDL
jgi:hypothetical protein